VLKHRAYTRFICLFIHVTKSLIDVFQQFLLHFRAKKVLGDPKTGAFSPFPFSYMRGADINYTFHGKFRTAAKDSLVVLIEHISRLLVR